MKRYDSPSFFFFRFQSFQFETFRNPFTWSLFYRTYTTTGYYYESKTKLTWWRVKVRLNNDECTNTIIKKVPPLFVMVQREEEERVKTGDRWLITDGKIQPSDISEEVTRVSHAWKAHARHVTRSRQTAFVWLEDGVVACFVPALRKKGERERG